MVHDREPLHNLHDASSRQRAIHLNNCSFKRGIVYDHQHPDKVVKLTDSPAYKYLSEADEGFLRYNRLGTPKINNKQRLDALLTSIKKNGYPYRDRYITILGDENIIRDGYHRAAILRNISGNIRVPVLKIIFKEGYTEYKFGSGSSAYKTARWILASMKNKAKRHLLKRRSVKIANLDD